MSFLKRLFGGGGSPSSLHPDAPPQSDGALNGRQISAIRDEVIVAAGPLLGPSIAAVLDKDDSFGLNHPGTDERWLLGREPFAPLTGFSPDERGRAFEHLVTLLDNPQQFGIATWGKLQLKVQRGCPDCDLVFPRGFKRLIGALAGRKMELANADRSMAAYLRLQPQTSGKCPSHKKIIEPLLRTIQDYPDGETINELRRLQERPYRPQLIYDNRLKIEQVLRELPEANPIIRTASSQALPSSGLPPIALPDFNLGGLGTVEAISDHFANLFEPRLYDHTHLDFLRRLAKVHVQIAGHTLEEPGLEKLVREAIVDAGFSDRGLKEVHKNYGFDLAIHILDSATRVGTLLLFHFKGFEPFMRSSPERLLSLAALASEISGKSKPTDKWREKAQGVFNGLTEDERFGMLDALLGNPSEASSAVLHETYLRTLIYLAIDLDPQKLGPRLVQYALKQFYVTLPGVGIRSERLGNACVWVLASMPDGAGVPYLARILARTKYPKIRAKIDVQLNTAAERAGMPRAELDEITVPTHGLDHDGTRRVDFDSGHAVLCVSGASADARWFNAAGTELKAAPAAMKAEKELFKELRDDLKELQADLAIQPQRLQQLYLKDRSWTAKQWRARYLDHPLTRGLARKLVWWVEAADGSRRAGLADPAGEALRDVTGDPVALDGATVRLWHPMDDSVVAVEAWRDRLEALELTQPFSQVWREVYALTDAERATGTYTNRWAAHILKQHQAMTLARLNGWRTTHRMWVDAPNDEPWHVVIPEHELVAQYWVEGAGGDSPETADSGAYAYVSTDRVIFYPLIGNDQRRAHGRGLDDAVTLESVPPVVFSEIMRHCDLFTAVSSIAADPEWLDRGEDAAHPNQWQRDAADYWRGTNTAELVESGKRRHAMLQRIVPRLKIAGRLRLEQKSLIVRGTRHEYEIHLGSGACSRGGRHICIVPKSIEFTGKDRIWLPFEGDRTLSIILSKAVLLAADDKITDPVILAQL